MAEHGDVLDPDAKLRRDLSLQQLIFIAIGSIIGSGWLFAVLSAGAVAGPAVIISWVIAAILVIFMALNYAETATMLPRTGGIARYPYLTHGRFLGFLLSWSMVLGAVTTVAIEALAVVQYSAQYIERWSGVALVSAGEGGTSLTPIGIACAIVLMVCFFLINVFGVKFFGRFNQYVTWWKIILPVITFVLLFFAFKGSNFSSYGGFAPRGGGSIFNAIAVSGIIFAFQGFREGVNFGGESRNPQRDIVLTTVFSVVITAIIYVLLQVAFIGAINWQSMGLSPGSWADLASGKWADQPLYSALQASGIALLGAFSTLLLVDAVISPAGTGWIFLGDGARTVYGMAVHGSLPKSFAKISARWGVPWAGLVACLVLGCVFFLPFPGWYQLIGYTSSTASLTYIAAAPQVRVLRRTASELHRPFFLRGSLLLSPLGFLAAAMVVYWSGFSVLRGVVASVLVAVALYAGVQAPRQHRLPRTTGMLIGAGFLLVWIVLQVFGPLGRNSIPFPLFWALCAVAVGVTLLGLHLAMDAAGRAEVRATSWALVLLLALYLLSYYGSYGSYGSYGPASDPLIKYPYDSGIAVLIGLATYYWAVHVGYRTPDLIALQETKPLPRKEVDA